MLSLPNWAQAPTYGQRTTVNPLSVTVSPVCRQPASKVHGQPA